MGYQVHFSYFYGKPLNYDYRHHTRNSNSYSRSQHLAPLFERSDRRKTGRPYSRQATQRQIPSNQQRASADSIRRHHLYGSSSIPTVYRISSFS